MTVSEQTFKQLAMEDPEGTEYTRGVIRPSALRGIDIDVDKLFDLVG